MKTTEEIKTFMSQIQTVKEQIAAAQARLVELEKQEKAEREAALKAFVPVYRYRVVPKTDGFDSLAIAVGAVCVIAEMENLSECRRLGGSNDATMHSVWYAWFNGMLHRGGGGHLILRDPAATSKWDMSDRPFACTAEEWASIRAGNIPEKFLSVAWGKFVPAGNDCAT